MLADDRWSREVTCDTDPGYDDELLDSPGPRGVKRSPRELAQIGIALFAGTWLQCRTEADYRRYGNHLRRQREFERTEGGPAE